MSLVLIGRSKRVYHQMALAGRTGQIVGDYWPLARWKTTSDNQWAMPDVIESGRQARLLINRNAGAVIDRGKNTKRDVCAQIRWWQSAAYRNDNARICASSDVPEQKRIRRQESFGLFTIILVLRRSAVSWMAPDVWIRRYSCILIDEVTQPFNRDCVIWVDDRAVLNTIASMTVIKPCECTKSQLMLSLTSRQTIGPPMHVLSDVLLKI